MPANWMRRSFLAAACASAALLAACGSSDVESAFTPTRFVAFGDAQADVGQVGGKSYTVNDGTLNIWTKQLASRFANWLRNAILHDETRDTGCGLKAVRTDVLRRLPFFDGTHRYVPALVIQEGFSVIHRDVIDRSRRHGKSNYGIFDRGLRGIFDLAGVWWLRRRRRLQERSCRPLGLIWPLAVRRARSSNQLAHCRRRTQLHRFRLAIRLSQRGR